MEFIEPTLICFRVVIFLTLSKCHWHLFNFRDAVLVRMSITVLLNRPVSCFYEAFVSKTFLLLDKTNVFDKPRAEGKSRSVCTMPRRENVCCEETKLFNWVLLTSQYFESNLWVHFKKFSSILFLQKNSWISIVYFNLYWAFEVSKVDSIVGTTLKNHKTLKTCLVFKVFSISLHAFMTIL